MNICQGYDIKGEKIAEGDTIRVHWSHTPCIGKDEVYDIVEKHKVVQSSEHNGLVIFRKGQAYLVRALTTEGNKPEITSKR